MQQFSLLQVLVLAVVQGVTEFLPVSSSGHLVALAPWLFRAGEVPADMLTVSIILHVGTLGSILVYYRERIARLLGEDRRAVGLLVVGSIPAGVIGVTIKLFFKELVESPLLAGAMLPVSGIILLWMSRQPAGQGTYQKLRWRDSLWIGICQAAAILPGLSRSGSTIAAGVSSGLARADAATYSFLLAIPAIGGAGLIESLSLIKHPPQTPIGLLLAGAIVAFVVGLVALWWLNRLLQYGRLNYFGWYCIALGVIVIAANWPK